MKITRKHLAFPFLYGKYLITTSNLVVKYLRPLEENHMARKLQDRCTRHVYAFLFVATAAATPTLAANIPFTWNGGTNGTWNTTATNTNWLDSASNPVAWPNTTTSNAIFGGADSTYDVTLGSTVTAGALEFNASGYTLSAASAKTVNIRGDADLTNDASLVVAAGKSATIGSNITLATTGFMTFIGGGTLNLAGVNINLGSNGPQLFIEGGSTLDIQTGSTVNFASSATIGALSSGGGNNNVLMVSGGTFSAGTFSVGKGNSTNCTFTVSNGSATVGNLNVYSAGTATDSTNVNLTGGTLSATSIVAPSGGSGKGFVNFDGGTFRPTASNSAFWVNSTKVTANVKAGGGTIDTQGFDITIAQPLVHSADLGATADGGIIKIGNGSLTLTGANTYTGQTNIQGGTLKINGSLANTAVTVGTITAASGTLGGSGSIGPVTSSTASVAVNSGGTLAPGDGSNTTGGTNAAGDIATLTINGSLGEVDSNDFGAADFDLDKTGDTLTNDMVIGLLSAPSFGGGTLQVNLTGSGFAAGDTWKLFDWTGGTITSTFASVPTGTLGAPPGLEWNTSNLYTAGEISLTSVPEPATAGLVMFGMLLGLRRSRRRERNSARGMD
jgi:autotransporter-associated beta strand protein